MKRIKQEQHSLQLGNANYTGLKCPTAKGTSQIDL